MASLAHRHLTLEEFDCLYGDRKPYHEYWFGEAIEKSGGTWLHGLSQNIVGSILNDFGFVAAFGVRLKLSADAQPLPDVIATSKPVGFPYPTRPFDVAVEILSPTDSMQYVLRKCRMYSQWGIQRIFIFDPEDKTAQEWNHSKSCLEPIETLTFEDRGSIPVATIWAELASRAERLGLNSEP